ncbi:hypothetical protein BHM03_00038567 [Ensete ventricosum]|nr:hypothetical protein BHM03_00038567 [Ensete ventricosum]
MGGGPSNGSDRQLLAFRRPIVLPPTFSPAHALKRTRNANGYLRSPSTSRVIAGPISRPFIRRKRTIRRRSTVRYPAPENVDGRVRPHR